MIEISIPVENAIDALVWSKKRIAWGNVIGYYSCQPGYVGVHSFWSPIEILLMDFAEVSGRDYDGDMPMILVLKFEDKNRAMECRLRFG